MFEETLPARQRQLCLTLGSIAVVRSFYLAGGTAAALHIGHRESVDLDFFRAEEIVPDAVGIPLAATVECRWDQYERNTLVGSAAGVKLSFFQYPYPLLQATDRYAGCAVASMLDVACMKLVAVGQRGRRRDFVDLHCLLNALQIDTWSLWTATQRKFSLPDDSLYWLARGLGYFEDAEQDPEPVMRWQLAWPQVRSFFQQQSALLLDRLASGG